MPISQLLPVVLLVGTGLAAPIVQTAGGDFKGCQNTTAPKSCLIKKIDYSCIAEELIADANKLTSACPLYLSVDKFTSLLQVCCDDMEEKEPIVTPPGNEDCPKSCIIEDINYSSIASELISDTEKLTSACPSNMDIEVFHTLIKTCRDDMDHKTTPVLPPNNCTAPHNSTSHCNGVDCKPPPQSCLLKDLNFAERACELVGDLDKLTSACPLGLEVNEFANLLKDCCKDVKEDEKCEETPVTPPVTPPVAPSDNECCLINHTDFAQTACELLTDNTKLTSACPLHLKLDEFTESLKGCCQAQGSLKDKIEYKKEEKDCSLDGLCEDLSLVKKLL